MANQFGDDLGVFVCKHVYEGAPVLYVVHDDDRDWQFLCGETHDGQLPVLVHVAHVLKRDPSLRAVEQLRCDSDAVRSARGEPWEITDRTAEKIRANITEHGWHVMLVAEDDEGPGFAYSIGMEETLGHPEVIVFGLSPHVMHWVVNEVGLRAKAGSPVALGQPVDELLEGVPCILERVDPRHHGKYFGHALRHRGGADLRAVQVFWPGKVTGHFPWDPGAPRDVVSAQPDLRTRPQR